MAPWMPPSDSEQVEESPGHVDLTKPAGARPLAAGGLAPERLVPRLATEWASALRFVTDPPTLASIVEVATHGEWTTDLSGPRRLAALAWAWAFAIPVAAIGFFVAWAFAWAPRALAVGVVAGLLATALTRFPFVHDAALWLANLGHAVIVWWLA